MVRDDLGLGIPALAQDFRRTLMQRKSPALQQAVISRVLDQRVLETIARLRRGAFDEEDVRLGEALERRLQPGFVPPGDLAQQLVRKIPPEHAADLRDLARFA